MGIITNREIIILGTIGETEEILEDNFHKKEITQYQGIIIKVIQPPFKEEIGTFKIP